MEEIIELTNFLKAIQDDHRIGATHISCYITLFQLYSLQGCQNPVSIRRADVMKLAKIDGIATYHKCIKDLTNYGYIVYKPSYNSSINSQVCLLKK